MQAGSVAARNGNFLVVEFITRRRGLGPCRAGIRGQRSALCHTHTLQKRHRCRQRVWKQDCLPA